MKGLGLAAVGMEGSCVVVVCVGDGSTLGEGSGGAQGVGEGCGGVEWWAGRCVGIRWYDP